MSVRLNRFLWPMPLRLRNAIAAAVVLLLIGFLPGDLAHAAPPKLSNSCGCEADASAVYGAGQDTCETYMAEYSANAEIREDVDSTFGQSLGWIAGYMSASNRDSGVRDIYDMSLDYVAYWISEWCGRNSDKTLLDAMEFLTEERGRKTGTLLKD